ncbi:hypothetical protein [Ramlibacter sp. WS9]|uniref:hypothetical protein n=1 Tax=Ramlibacter sp. WS9 TaxID=1882741 RepID=UPI0011436DE8|nr:hypothetical protein [Ramlibacter sp. WS9]ROZ69668.1 hypothetical protein EEB15_22485 [Ramlibacter sp. WS9]
MLYVKTDAGRGEMQGRAHPLTPSQRQVLILCDGERHLEDLLDMMPVHSCKPALDHLIAAGLVVLRDAAEKVKPVEVELSESDRYRAVVELATSMAADLGFTARIKAQLQIEKAQSMQDLTDVVDLLCKHLKATPLMALRLNKLKQLVHA